MRRVARRTPAGVMELYPSQYARTKRYPNSRETPEQARHGEDAETHAIRCAQCGALIEDCRALAQCWLCESENFKGVRL